MQKKRAILCGYYGMGNAGDEALLVCLLQSLPDHIEPIVLSKNPTETQDRYPVKACDRWDLKAVTREMRQADFFIWGGGSLMQDSSSRVSPIYYGGLMKLAQSLGLTTIAWAQGLGPLNHRSNRWLTRHVLKRCRLVTVRDKVSQEMVQAWKIPVTIAPDPVWAMIAEKTLDLSHLPKPRIAVNLRDHSSLTVDRLEVITQALIQLQQETQGTVVLLPFQESLDGQLARDLQEKIPGSLVQFIEAPQVLKGIFREVELTIAMRLHGVIMSVSEGCPCFALSYDPKVMRVMEVAKISGLNLLEFDSSLSPELKRGLVTEWLQLLGQVGGVDEGLWPIEAHREDLIKNATEHRNLLQKALDIST
jgi:polysaccharide pyruvyl transferase CsaB